jgi:ADP-heptose:LPS heptosyltransferase
MGDILRVLPAWKNIMAAWPGARVQAVIEDRHAFLFEPLVGIEPVIVRRSALSNPLKALRELSRAAELIKGADASLDFHGILKSALIPYFAGITERWGDGVNKEGAGWLQNNGPAYKKQDRYSQALGLAEAFGRKHGLPNLGRFEPILRNATLPQNNAWCPESRPRILLVPGTSRAGANKRWPLQNWIRLANVLKGKADLRWSLGPDEDALRLPLPLRSDVEALPVMPFWELASTIRTVDRVIVGDTGLLHLSVLLGVPVTALMGPSDPIISDIPPGAGAVARAGAECSPCRERRCLRRDCMEQLQLEEVLGTL